MPLSEKAKHMAEGGEVEEREDSDHEMMMDHVAMELMHAMELKDKASFLDAFHVMVADCCEKMEPAEGEGDE